MLMCMDASTAEDLGGAARDYVIEKYGNPPPLRVLIAVTDVLSVEDSHRVHVEWRNARRGLGYTELRGVHWDLEPNHHFKPHSARASRRKL
jgi:hypothetical protein